MTKILFKKIGMTTMFSEKFEAHGITLLKLEKTTCFGHKTLEKEGYSCSLISSGQKKKPNKPLEGERKKRQLDSIGKIYEWRPKNKEDNLIPINENITVEKFLEIFGNKKVKATGRSKGKGFSGTIKRWNFRGLRASHGVGACERSGGSTGQRTEAGRTFKNKKMAGHYGNEKVSISNLTIYGINKELSLVFIKGSVPGPNKGFVYLSPMKEKEK